MRLTKKLFLKIILLWSKALLILLILCSASARASVEINTEEKKSSPDEIPYDIRGLDFLERGLKEAILKNIQTALDAEHPSPAKSVLLIQRALEPFGYFKSAIRYQLNQPNQLNQANQENIIYTIQLGEPIKFSDVTITYQGETKQALPKNYIFSLRTGDIFSTERYEKAKEEILLLLQQEGYLNAKFIKDDLVINIPNYTCQLTLALDAGQRFYFGAIHFSPTPFNKKFLKKYLLFHAREPFSYEKLLTLQQDLTNSGYFERVSAVPAEIKNQQDLPIHIDLMMRKKKLYRFGLGYTSNSGARATIEYGVRWLNSWGHQLNTSLKLLSTEQNLALQYLIPGRKPAHEQYALQTSILHQKPTDGESLTTGIGVSQIRNYTKWQRSISVDYELERYESNAPTDDNQTRFSRLLLPSIRFSSLDANDMIHPTQGNRFTVNLRGATPEIASSVSFAQTQLSYKRVDTLIDSGNRLLLRGDVGYTTTDNWQKLPLSKRFYAGGTDSIRGYADKNLGPGKYLLVGSAEFQRRIIKNWYGAIFYDTGNAMMHWDEKLERGVGVGVIFQSPIGDLRLYLAQAISKKNKPYQVEFSFGPDL